MHCIARRRRILPRALPAPLAIAYIASMPAQAAGMNRTRYGLTNFSVIRSLSPIALYLASSAASWLLLGGSVHTPPE